MKWRHNLLPIGRKSHKQVNLGPCSGRDFSITVRSISKGFTVLERAIQGLHLLLCNTQDIFASWPWKLGSKWRTVVVLHKWMIEIFSKTPEAKQTTSKHLKVSKSVPEMTSSTTSGRPQIPQTCQFWVMISRKRCTDFKQVYCFMNIAQSLHLLFCKSLDKFVLAQKMRPKEAYRGQGVT